MDKMKRIKILLILVSIIIFTFLILNIVYIPSIQINASNTSKLIIEEKIKSKSVYNFTFIRIIRNINYVKIIPLYASHKIVKNSILKCKIDIVQNIEYYHIKLNGYSMIVNKEGILVDPGKESNDNVANPILFDINIKSNNDTKTIFNQRISPFLFYILKKYSKLYFIIKQINYDDIKGLFFTEYDSKKIVFGKRDDYEYLEKCLLDLKNALKEKNMYSNYNVFDFSFIKRIILRHE
jgi:hypothetical protein